MKRLNQIIKSIKMRSCNRFLKIVWGPIVLGTQFKIQNMGSEASMTWSLPTTSAFSHTIHFLQKSPQCPFFPRFGMSQFLSASKSLNMLFPIHGIFFNAIPCIIYRRVFANQPQFLTSHYIHILCNMTLEDLSSQAQSTLPLLNLAWPYNQNAAEVTGCQF